MNVYAGVLHRYIIPIGDPKFYKMVGTECLGQVPSSPIRDLFVDEASGQALAEKLI
jgi:hypothetical protein